MACGRIFSSITVTEPSEYPALEMADFYVDSSSQSMRVRLENIIIEIKPIRLIYGVGNGLEFLILKGHFSRSYETSMPVACCPVSKPRGGKPHSADHVVMNNVGNMIRCVAQWLLIRRSYRSERLN